MDETTPNRFQKLTFFFHICIKNLISLFEVYWLTFLNTDLLQQELGIKLKPFSKNKIFEITLAAILFAVYFYTE